MSFATLYECLLPAENSYDDLSVCLRANMCKCSLKWDYPKLFCKHDMIILQQSIHPVIHFDNLVVTTSNVYSISHYNLTIPSNHSAIELPTVNSAIYARHTEHLNSLEHTLNISTAWRVEPQSALPLESRSTWKRMVRHASEASSNQRCLRFGASDDLLPPSFEHRLVGRSRSMPWTNGSTQGRSMARHTATRH